MARTWTALLVGAVAASLVACSIASTGPAAQGPGGSPAGLSSSLAGTGPGSSPSPAVPDVTASPEPVKTLPRGGRTLFPAYRLVGYAGAPAAEGLGRLGIGELDERVVEMEKRAAPYTRGGRKILPVLELIATIANRGAGKDGAYRSRSGDAIVKRYLAAARRHKAMLLLDIQPGRADFLPEAKAYEKWLRQPDVGLALDPEWAVRPGDVPGEAYGTTTGRELDEVARYLSELVQTNGLPEKPLIFHQVAASIVTQEKGLRRHPGVALIKSVDGIGGPRPKRQTWDVLTCCLARHVRSGFKLFYLEDVETGGRLMTPREVLALRPQPDYVLYE